MIQERQSEDEKDPGAEKEIKNDGNAIYVGDESKTVNSRGSKIVANDNEESKETDVGEVQ